MHTKLWVGYSADTWERVNKARALEAYEKGYITLAEYENIMIEWSSEEDGRRFYYECPKCLKPMRHCPDPACAEEGVGHHLFDNPRCKDGDIPYATANRVYFPTQRDDGALQSEVLEPGDR